MADEELDERADARTTLAVLSIEGKEPDRTRGTFVNSSVLLPDTPNEHSTSCSMIYDLGAYDLP